MEFFSLAFRVAASPEARLFRKSRASRRMHAARIEILIDTAYPVP